MTMSRTEILTIALLLGVIGLVSGLAVLQARSRQRDTVRILHVREMQFGLDLYFGDHAEYPTAKDPVALGQPATACLGDSGFTGPCVDTAAATAYIPTIAVPPTAGLGGKSTCGGAKNVYCYTSNAKTFGVSFELERNFDLLGLKKGLNCALPGSLRPGACPAIQ